MAAAPILSGELGLLSLFDLWTAKDERTYGVTRVSFLAPVTRDP